MTTSGLAAMGLMATGGVMAAAAIAFDVFSPTSHDFRFDVFDVAGPGVAACGVGALIGGGLWWEAQQEQPQ